MNTIIFNGPIGDGANLLYTEGALSIVQSVKFGSCSYYFPKILF